MGEGGELSALGEETVEESPAQILRREKRCFDSDFGEPGRGKAGLDLAWRFSFVPLGGTFLCPPII